MRTLYRFAHLAKRHSVIHAVSKKDPDEPYAFSLALHTGENPGKIIANRKRLARELAVDEELLFVTADQTHSDHIAVIESREMCGWDREEGALRNCDALVTDLTGVALTVLTADCVPILLFDPTAGVIAAVHAGWRGTEKEIVSKTIAVMADRFDSVPADILAGVGPAIGKCCYEVGEDVASHFEACSETFLQREGGRYRLDLPGINREQMLSAGLRPEQIEMSAVCTACNSDTFFSYRGEKGCSGRFMSLIALRRQSS